jgi:hypothetical protein
MSRGFDRPFPRSAGERRHQVRIAAVLVGVPVAAAISFGALAAPLSSTASLAPVHAGSRATSQLEFIEDCGLSRPPAILASDVPFSAGNAAKWPACAGD